jgi:hypothetical protein
MDESEKAAVRACLDQVIVGLAEAREVKSWWETLGFGVQWEYRNAESRVAVLRRADNLK